ncbi:methyltransferase domain-containing protein [Lentithecium fluviatile CBS 122367]|uniref:Methyltransferase domain-containing protein n=1 Tax=Lentithecium fluviatile CBS 122367 TaxID=1168545 RepID=A0A6G1J7E0_9PLEO|nr:methyltransferase domain-containing protein [Lentithecium fluviatile CBS 122367]
MTAVTTNIEWLNRAYSAKGLSDLRSLYDEWAASYDSDLAKKDQEYVAPALAAATVAKHLSPTPLDTVKILDAGCGTGLVGKALAQLGAKHIDGVDLSPGMLDVARKLNVYTELDTIDLSKPLDQRTASYDVVTCIGTLTHAHVGPEVLSEFVRVVKPGGWIVATVLDDIWEPIGYRAEVDELLAQGKVELVSADVGDYRRGAGVRARMVVLKVIGPSPSSSP